MKELAQWLLQVIIYAVAIECTVRWGRIGGWLGVVGGAVALVMLGWVFMQAGLPSLENANDGK